VATKGGAARRSPAHSRGRGGGGRETGEEKAGRPGLARGREGGKQAAPVG
jgi:hypothetical protein